MHVEGECRMCGACCRTNIQWVSCEERDVAKNIEFLEARGRRVVQVAQDRSGRFRLIQGVFDDECPALAPDNRCGLHGPKKPMVCREYPASDLYIVWKIDMNKVLAPGCGYRFVEDDDDSD